MNVLIQCLYALGVYAAYLAGALQLRAGAIEARARAPRQPYATLVLALLVVIPTTVQFFFAPVLGVFERDAARIAAGQWWRLATSLLVQDGGIGGSVSNLVGLLLVGRVAECEWGSGRCVLLFFFGGVAGNLAGLAWQPVGAGNSVANFALAASVAFVVVLAGRPRIARLPAAIALGADGCLLLLKDIHGAAALVGIGMALAFIAARRPRGA